MKIKYSEKNILDQRKHPNSLMLQSKVSLIGQIKVSSPVIEQKEDIVDLYTQISSIEYPGKVKNTLNQKEEDISATVESPLLPKKKTWKDKLNISEANTLAMKSLKILDQESISKEKDLTPFWTQQSKEISEKLWLPTEIDCVDSVLNSSKEYSQTPMGKSWFSIKKKLPQKKNSLMTSFQLSQFSLPESMDSEATKSKMKSKKPGEEKEEKKQVKTIKMRIFPSEDDKKELNIMFNQFRWYYNTFLTLFYTHYGHENILKYNSYSNYSVRQIFRKYEFTEETLDHLTFQDFKYDESRNETMVPSWWEKQVHNRLPRGVIKKLVTNMNSAITNYKNKNISKFDLKFMSKKKPTEYLHFEDKHYPGFIKEIKSVYWFTTRDKRRINIPLSSIDCQERGIEIIYEKNTGKYFLHYPVDIDWYPKEDRRNDKQVKFFSKGERIISLDPGVRKFLVGYDPGGETIFIGEQAHLELTYLLREIDKSTGDTFELWKKVKNLVSELHWKTISFLIENYDTIILPDFRVSQMIKGKKLAKITKRLMCMFSFFSFKEKLKFKCNMYGKKLIIVDESYTSRTCGTCGFLNNMKGKEQYKCTRCGLKIDRDVLGSRNILIKNIRLRCPGI